MTSFLKLAIIGTVLLGVAHGANLTAAEKETYCELRSAIQTFLCIERLRDFAAKVDELDMDKKSELKEFKKTCDSLKNCFAITRCGPNSTMDEAELFRMVEKNCEAVVYIHEDFSDCSDKLTAKKSVCFDNWDPIPDGIHLEEDEKKVEKMKKETCKRYFGKDDCMKKEIVETCSQKEWDKFREQFINLSSDLVSKCDFSRLG
ncbi:UPF0376 protein C36C5.12 [Caenorhabditis elegans]|nr:UPF0376 protein C36C5.12 [Caenorhabditis elegans]CCD66864.2 UPF0376 protein C36C5.12 [Caenorhabditis elegans]|eukprot:NP_503869.2 UPF0376 protein C36C5.12 [Caenorhabditis elegans]